MLKFIQKKLKEEKGLTLIELLAVIVILGIIAAIAIPAIGNIIENSRFGGAKADMQNAIAAANLYIAERGTDPTNLTDIQPYLEDQGSLTAVTFDRPTTGDDAGTLRITADIDLDGAGSTEENYTGVGPYTNAALSDLSNSQFKDAVQAGS